MRTVAMGRRSDRVDTRRTGRQTAPLVPRLQEIPFRLMNTNANNAAMDGRFPQFPGGQGLVSGYGNLAGNIQALQNLQGAAAAGYGLQTQMQASRCVMCVCGRSLCRPGLGGALSAWSL